MIVDNVQQHIGKTLGNGHCVHLVYTAPNVPNTSMWKRGPKVKGLTDLPEGTCIATFGGNGRYENKTDGSSHAAVYVGQTEDCLIVYDQWLNKPVSARNIWFRNGKGKPVDDGDQYYIIV